jgi:hypothetical protein
MEKVTARKKLVAAKNKVTVEKAAPMRRREKNG